MRKRKILSVVYLLAALCVIAALFVLWRSASETLDRTRKNGYLCCTVRLGTGARHVGTLLRGVADDAALSDAEQLLQLRCEIAVCRNAVAQFPTDRDEALDTVDAFFQRLEQEIAVPLLRGEPAADSTTLQALSGYADTIADEMDTLSVFFLKDASPGAASADYRVAAQDALTRILRTVREGATGDAVVVSGQHTALPEASGGLSVYEARTAAGEVIGSVAAYLTGTGTVTAPAGYCFFCDNYYAVVEKRSGRLLSLSCVQYGTVGKRVGEEEAQKTGLAFAGTVGAGDGSCTGTLCIDDILFLQYTVPDCREPALIGVTLSGGRVCLYRAAA